MLANGNKDLSGHVTALLGSGSLVLNVDTGGTLLDEELGELHDGSETAMASIGVGNDGSEVVNVGDTGALVLGGSKTLLALLAVVEELGLEEVADLVGDGGLLCGHATLELVLSVPLSSGGENLRRGNRPNRDRAHRWRRRWKKIASRRHRLYQGTWPSESPS